MGNKKVWNLNNPNDLKLFNKYKREKNRDKLEEFNETYKEENGYDYHRLYIASDGPVVIFILKEGDKDKKTVIMDDSDKPTKTRRILPFKAALHAFNKTKHVRASEISVFSNNRNILKYIGEIKRGVHNNVIQQIFETENVDKYKHSKFGTLQYVTMDRKTKHSKIINDIIEFQRINNYIMD